MIITRFCAFLLLCFAGATAQQCKFMLTAPQVLNIDHTEKMVLDIIQNTRKADIQVSLVNPRNNTYLHRVILKKPDENEYMINFTVPYTELYSASLEVECGDEEIVKTDIKLKSRKNLVFIETDKPFYKPGELVRFRVLQLERDLKPVTKTIGRIWIESSNHIKMAQWKQVKVQGGFAQLELQLSSEPVQGTWKIKVQAADTSETTERKFEVKEYVLPKYEVTITPPPYIVKGEYNNYTWRVCAMYSFGKPVQGTATVKLTFIEPRFHWRNEEKMKLDEADTVLTRELRKDGCQEFRPRKELFDQMETVYTTGVIASVEVKERGTGEVQKSWHTSAVHRTRISFDTSRLPKYYYPHLPYFGEVYLKYQNGRPVKDEEVNITVFGDWGPDSHITAITDARGKFDFTIAPLDYYRPIIIEFITKAPLEKRSVIAFHEAVNFFSPSDSYLLIYAPAKVECYQTTDIRIYYTHQKDRPNEKFHYLIKSRGEIVVKGEIATEKKEDHTLNDTNIILRSAESKRLGMGSAYLQLRIEPEYSPDIDLIVYYFNENKEIVASHKKIKVSDCLKHRVFARFREFSARPGAPVTMGLSTSSPSLCALSGKDKAVTFLDTDRALNLEKAMRKIESVSGNPPYDVDDFTVELCLDIYPGFKPGLIPQPDMLPEDGARQKRRMHFPLIEEFANTKRAFLDGAATILSNLHYNKKPCFDGIFEENCNECPYYPFPPHNKFKNSMMSILMSSKAPAFASPTLYDTPEAAHDADGDKIKDEDVEMRSQFPETWLWQLEEISERNEKLWKLKTPHSITDWVLNAVCVSSSEGLGIARETLLRVIKPYFMDFTLPYSVKQFELLPLKVSLFNYLNDALPIELTFGTFTGGVSYSKKKFSTCLQPRDSLVHTFYLEALALGVHNISVTADLTSNFNGSCRPPITENMRDGVTKSVIVKPEGYPVEITNSIFICLDDKNETAEISWHLAVPPYAVPDSARGEVSVIGDVMGPSFENLDGLVRLPMGCGEQNMVLFVPNIVVLGYLNATGVSNPTLRDSAISNMVRGYQRELTYRHDDGSYSVFGKSDSSGSMWLTAFVVKSFAQAKQHIFIDTKDLERSVKWIQRHQLENGCFPQIGHVLNKQMKGGVEHSTSAEAALSAYVLISLLETKMELKKSLIEDSVSCLTRARDTDTYSTVLIAYALQLIKEQIQTTEMSQAADRYLGLVISKSLRSNENEIFWQNKGSNNLALSVEITGYAVLTLVKAGGEENLLSALSAIKWISRQRNSMGGFVSTQDTVVALEALAKYASSLPAGDVKMHLTATTDDSDGKIMDFKIDEENRQILQQRELQHLPTNVHWKTTGRGCALIQSTRRYNIPWVSEKETAFILKNNVTNIIPGKCNELFLQIELAYELADEASNMAVLEVELLSGYEPVRSTLDELSLKTNLNFKRWDVEQGKVNIYFDTIKKGETLQFGFVIEQRVLVEKIKPAQMKLYDYYEQESFVRLEYGLEELKCQENLDAIGTGLDEQPKDEQSDERGNKRENEVDDRFREFKNVDFDLDNPDGVEGPVPVYVPAPKNAYRGPK